MPIISISDERCVNCGACVKICPMDVLRAGDAKPEISYPQDCQSCFLCGKYCKANAIEITAERARPTVLPW